MPNGERLNINPELNVETPRSTYEARGEKANESVMGEDLSRLSEAELMKRKETLEQELADIARRKAEIKQRLGMQEAVKVQDEIQVKLEEEAKVEEGDVATVESVSIIEPVAASEPEVIPSSVVPPESSVPSPETTPAQVDPETARATYERAKNSSGLKNRLKKIAMVAVPIALAALIAIGSFVGNRSTNQQNNDPATNIEYVMPAGEEQETLGIIDGYGEKGMWLSENKTGRYNFGYAPEVAETCQNNEQEMVKYTAKNQVESFADYLTALPTDLQPAGFQGLSLKECEAKLESLSDEDYDSLREEFNGIMDSSVARQTVLNGRYQNAYMRLQDANGDVVHENMELVACNTDENGFRAVEFVWYDEDGQEIGSMIVKIQQDEKGDVIGGCMQVVEKEGKNPNRLTDLPEVPDNPSEDPEPTPPTPNPDPDPDPTPPTPTPDPEPTPTPENIAPKDEENLVRIDDQILDDIADDIGTEEVEITKTEEVSEDDLTEKPSSDEYQGTEPTIVQNTPSIEAEQIQPEQISPENNYSEDRGGAHQNEYAPVQEDTAAQAAADAAEIPVNNAPTGGQELEDILADLGIN